MFLSYRQSGESTCGAAALLFIAAELRYVFSAPIFGVPVADTLLARYFPTGVDVHNILTTAQSIIKVGPRYADLAEIARSKCVEIAKRPEQWTDPLCRGLLLLDFNSYVQVHPYLRLTQKDFWAFLSCQLLEICIYAAIRLNIHGQTAPLNGSWPSSICRVLMKMGLNLTVHIAASETASTMRQSFPQEMEDIKTITGKALLGGSNFLLPPTENTYALLLVGTEHWVAQRSYHTDVMDPGSGSNVTLEKAIENLTHGRGERSEAVMQIIISIKTPWVC